MATNPPSGDGHRNGMVSNHLYFHTPSEPPLFKGDSRDVKNKK